MDSVVSEMGAGEVALVAVASFVGAAVIGAVGIGGVIILPALILAGVHPAKGIVTQFIALMPMVGRCKPVPGLKLESAWFQMFKPNDEKLAFKLNLVSS